MRLFFALWPDADAETQLSSVANKLTLKSPARLITPENYHVTLAFVGEVCESDVPVYREMGATLNVPPCAIGLDACEYWPSSQAAVMAAREIPGALVPVTDQLRTAVAAHMPSRGAEKSWRAHVTLARKVAQAPVLPAMSSVLWVSHSFSLMRSDTGGSESVYTVVDSWPLLDET